MEMKYERWIARAEREHRLEAGEIAALLEEERCHEALVAAADRTRRKYVGDAVHLRGLIEFSNICRQNCMYCGLRAKNAKVERYRLRAEEIVALAVSAKAHGYQTVVMQSGEDLCFSVDRLTEILRQIKALDLAITLSIGEKTAEEYAAYKQAGADRYLLRIETTERELYERFHPGMSFDHRLRCLEDLKRLGYEVGTGCLIGLPGQSALSLANDLLFFQRIDADMIGVGPFIPNGDTPLREEKGGELAVSLRFIALLRLLLPDIHIPATTAMEALDSNARIDALQGGANVVMPNVTEGAYRRKYMLYPGKTCVDDSPAACRRFMEDKILGMGRTVAVDYGYRIRR